MIVRGNSKHSFLVDTLKIGVLGGIGPEATGEFYNKLISTLQEKGLIKSNKDFPQIIVNSIPAPELIYDTISEEELQPYIDGLKELDSYDVDFIVMVCNTIHLYHERLQKEVKVPILDLRKELRDKLQREYVKSVLVIGTPSTIRQGLYRFDDLKCFEPSSEEMSVLTESIFEFNKGIDKENQTKKARDICEKYLSKGAGTVVLGCTEFAVMLGDEDMPTINTIDVLVESAVLRFMSNKNF
ncbi:aspartate/glutamate racemase family protein [Thermoproteota archaeon]